MGALLSKQKSDPNDYEQILSELDEKIQKAEVRLSEIKIRERRTGVLWIIYGTIAWAAFLLYSFIALHGSEDIDWDTSVMTLLPVLVIPLGIYYTRRLLKWFYTRKQTNEEANLGALRAQQKLKVEELKKKTSYYTTKSLLERYDLAAAQKKKQEQAQRNGQAAMATARQLPSPGQQQQQLRQRNGGPGPAPLQQGQSMAHPQQQQHQQQGGPIPNHGPGGLAVPRPLMPQPQQPRERQWYDKLVDALVGEEGPETKYALICRHCFMHNGLVLPQEIDYIQYTCPNCKQFNPARKIAVRPTSPAPSSPLPPQHQATVSDENKSKNSITPEPQPSVMMEENGKDGHHQGPSEETGPVSYRVSDEDDDNNDKSNILNNTNTDGIKTS
ncbi:hypothetical protein BDC45DRAFT_525281 [Circinella umbellata]|nr:hypothetical protein BDC45DRAFT_525281 [Circinella umbellata]